MLIIIKLVIRLSLLSVMTACGRKHSPVGRVHAVFHQTSELSLPSASVVTLEGGSACILPTDGVSIVGPDLLVQDTHFVRQLLVRWQQTQFTAL